jgi:hypothetical protein
MMNYQVMLTDSSDQPLADQAVTLVFRIYDAPSAGTQQWTETHNVTTNSIGVVSVILGETTPLPVASFGAALWLQVQANGEILLPRRKLVSAPYALHAIDSDAGGTADGHSLDASDGSPVDAVYVDAAGNVGFGTTGPTRNTHVHQTGPAYIHFTNTTTGTSAVDGLIVGTESAGISYVWNYENDKLILGTQDHIMLTLDHAGIVKVGNTYDWAGRLDLVRPGAASQQLTCTSDAYGGTATFFDEAGNTTVLISPDNSGTGGLVHVSKDATYSADEGIDLNGNWAGAEEPALRVIGTVRMAGFYMGSSGNLSVQLPADAIADTEILDEPGVARNQNLSGILLSGGVDVLTSRSITVPAGGYVLALGTSEAFAVHTSGSSSYVRIGLSSTTGIPPAQSAETQVPSGAPSGYYSFVVTSHEIFPVASAGTYTFYYLADEGAGDWSIDTMVLSLAYFPTAYGTVAPAGLDADAGVPSGRPDDGVRDTEGSPLTPADIAAEQAEAREFALARVERELAEIRAEVEAMKGEPGVQAAPAVAPVVAPAAVSTEEPRGPSVPAE